MLTLFILKSGDPNADPKKTLDSFNGVKNFVSHYVYADSLEAINSFEKETDWYCIIYDNEIVDDSLVRVPFEKDGRTMLYCPLKIHLRNNKADVLVLFKKQDGVMSKAPRIFRKHVKLSDSLMPPDKTLKFDRVLDGWIKSFN